MPTPTSPQPFTRTRRLPWPVVLGYTAFMAVLIPTYWLNYGPTNFLYFCDIALLLTLVGVWTESALLISAAAVGILAPQFLWVADFVVRACGGHLTGMTDYMFNHERSLFLRGLSLFHGWLPFLLLYLVHRVGFHRRGFALWTALAWAAMAVSWFLLPGPRADAAAIPTPVNVNYVHGLSDTAAQTWMHPWAWLTLLVAGLPLLVWGPTHLLLARLWGRRHVSP